MIEVLVHLWSPVVHLVLLVVHQALLLAQLEALVQVVPLHLHQERPHLVHEHPRGRQLQHQTWSSVQDEGSGGGGVHSIRNIVLVCQLSLDRAPGECEGQGEGPQEDLRHAQPPQVSASEEAARDI